MATKVLMVCLGNICRSPLAEGILKSKVDSKHVKVDSSGTSAYHQGELPDQRSIDIANLNSIDITDQRSRPFLKSDFEEFDYIYVMDASNYKNVCELTDKPEYLKKVKMIMNARFESLDIEVPDPYHDSINGFKNVYEMLDEACTVIANKLN